MKAWPLVQAVSTGSYNLIHLYGSTFCLVVFLLFRLAPPVCIWLAIPPFFFPESSLSLEVLPNLFLPRYWPFIHLSIKSKSEGTLGRETSLQCKQIFHNIHLMFLLCNIVHKLSSQFIFKLFNQQHQESKEAQIFLVPHSAQYGGPQISLCQKDNKNPEIQVQIGNIVRTYLEKRKIVKQ